MRRVWLLLALAGVLSAGTPANAQDQPPGDRPEPRPLLTGTLSAGLGLTSGNKDTTTFNGSYDLKYELKGRNLVRSSGLFLYGKTDGELSSEQYRLTARDEYTVSRRLFVFGEVRYFHDRFKGISSLVAPTAGGGYKAVDTRQATLAFSGGIGGVWEQDYDTPLKTTGAVTFEQKFTRRLSRSAAFTQSFSTLWNLTAFGDGLYQLGLTLTSTLVGRTELKVEALDTFKTRPPQPGLRRNDVTLLTGISYKF
jgi:putative salt-induced outer membrane protein YdiY